MAMTFELTIGGVDGETNIIAISSDTSTLRQLLTQHDHEGSSVTIRVTADSEEAFKLLATLEAVGK